MPTMTRSRLSSLIVPLLLVTACSGPFRTLWHDVKLPSGKTVKVTSCLLTWGVEHDDRDVTKDSFALEYVVTEPQADAKRRESEALEVFELIRPTSELWGLPSASIAAFPKLERKGRYDLYVFQHQPDGRWTLTRSEMKVFAND